jgi:hypothetical protein
MMMAVETMLSPDTATTDDVENDQECHGRMEGIQEQERACQGVNLLKHLIDISQNFLIIAC